jgi:hypothetical protein
MKDYTHIVASSAIVPVRIEASDASEMVTQMLLGETASILEIHERWIKVVCDFDDYVGWISVAQCYKLTSKSYNRWITDPEATRSLNRWFHVTNLVDNRLVVPLGALVAITENTHIRLPFGTYTTQESLQEVSSNNPLDTALSFLGVPYLWGGRSEAGIDCSGLMQLVYLLHGVKIPRDASQQEKFFSKRSDTIEDALPGDVFFFKNENGHVYHVGFALGKGLLLHASGTVKKESIQAINDESPVPFNQRLSDTFCGVYRLPEK